MHDTSGTDGKARVGDAFPALKLAATSGQLVTVPDPAGAYVHLQLRRFARARWARRSPVRPPHSETTAPSAARSDRSSPPEAALGCQQSF